MQLPVEILDHIFSFLSSDWTTLIASSKDSVLSPIVERHAYHHIIVQFGVRTADSNDPLTFGPDNLSKIVSEKPHIVYHVRILQIRILVDNSDEEMDYSKSDFSKTLLMFPVLECIMLAASEVHGWRVLDSFRAALEDRLSLPTLKEVHFIGGEIPISLLNSKNIEILQLSSWSLENPLSPSTLPQPHSLRLLRHYYSYTLLPWVKLHGKELRSFKSALFSWKELSKVLEVCSGTLNKLDIALRSAQLLAVDANGFRKDLQEFPPVLPNLQQLIIRIRMNRYHQIWLPVVTEVANLFLSSLRHLSIDINITLATDSESELTLVDFSSLAVLGATSRSVPRIDLFVHTGVLAPHITRAHTLSSLEVYEDIARLIKEGTLIIHPEKIVPECV